MAFGELHIMCQDRGVDPNELQSLLARRDSRQTAQDFCDVVRFHQQGGHIGLHNLQRPVFRDAQGLYQARPATLQIHAFKGHGQKGLIANGLRMLLLHQLPKSLLELFIRRCLRFSLSFSLSTLDEAPDGHHVLSHGSSDSSLHRRHGQKPMWLAFHRKGQPHHVLAIHGTTMQRLKSPDTPVVNKVRTFVQNILHCDVANWHPFIRNREGARKNVTDQWQGPIVVTYFLAA
mmetsp:Transcript_19035/g.31157  ORF Transcript_19035/g.31157 Transcript_19035/m.31157 type:complete len:232 (+) Transcript_19035:1038-1733(+)